MALYEKSTGFVNVGGRCSGLVFENEDIPPEITTNGEERGGEIR